jgi:hypothetical protein
MKTLLISVLFAVLFCGSASAQLRRTSRKPTPAEIAKLNKQYEQILKETKDETFENFKLLQDQIYRTKIERLIIPRGDSVRIRYVFKADRVVRIAVEGGGTTTPKDIRNGVFVTTICPKKTMWVKDQIDSRDQTGKISTQEFGWRVIVVEPEKYDSIKAIYDKLPEGKPRNAFADSLSGGTLRDFRLGKIK